MNSEWLGITDSHGLNFIPKLFRIEFQFRVDYDKSIEKESNPRHSKPIRIIPNVYNLVWCRSVKNQSKLNFQFWSIRINMSSDSFRLKTWFGFIRTEKSNWSGLFFNLFVFNEIQNICRIGSETDSGLTRNSSDSLGLNSSPKLSTGYWLKNTNFIIFRKRDDFRVDHDRSFKKESYPSEFMPFQNLFLNDSKICFWTIPKKSYSDLLELIESNWIVFQPICVQWDSKRSPDWFVNRLRKDSEYLRFAQIEFQSETFDRLVIEKH